MEQVQPQLHNIEPIYDTSSRILILGSFPSVKSRQAEFFYHHPQNRFWKIMEHLFDVSLTTIDEKKQFLLSHHIAIWDVIESCEISGSSDASIRHVKANDLNRILKVAPIQKIYTNGATSARYYKKYCYPETEMEAVTLPSTSPANATYSLERLLEEWNQILTVLHDDSF